MALKRRMIEPTYASIFAQRPTAVINPNTNEPVNPNRIYMVLRED